MTTRDDASTVIDRNTDFIYGIQPGESQLTFESLVNVDGNGRLIYNWFNGAFGTGTVVSVIDNETNVVVEDYTIVIFGDINGDCNADSTDAGYIIDYENYFIHLDPMAEAAQLKAADLNGDGNVDSVDADLIVDSENYLITIDQTTGFAMQN